MENIKDKQQQVDGMINLIEEAEAKLDDGVTKSYQKI